MYIQHVQKNCTCRVSTLLYCPIYNFIINSEFHCELQVLGDCIEYMKVKTDRQMYVYPKTMIRKYALC